MKRKAGEGSNSLRLVVDVMQLRVQRRVMQQPMNPIGEELVKHHVHGQVHWEQVGDIPVVLHLRVERVAKLYERDQRRLDENVNHRPFYVH